MALRKKKEEQKIPEEMKEPIEILLKTPATEEEMIAELAGKDGEGQSFEEPYAKTDLGFDFSKRRGDPVTAQQAMSWIFDAPDDKRPLMTTTPRRTFFTLVANETLDRVSMGEANFLTGISVSQILRQARDIRAPSLDDGKGCGWSLWAAMTLGTAVAEEQGGGGSFI